MAFYGIADACEWYDDYDQEFHIEGNAHNRIGVLLFG
jgi:hypothetical protein